MAIINDLDGWSPRVHQIKRINESWGIGDDETLESIMDVIDVLEEIIDDFKAFRQANRPSGSMTVPPLTVRDGGF